MSDQSQFYNPRLDRMALTGAGFILPRLTTAQRLGLTVGANDAGLQLFDTTAGAIYLWNGSAWSAVGGGGGGDPILETSRAFSGIDYKAVYFPQAPYAVGLSMADGQLFLQSIWVPENCTITGVSFSARTNGNYTGDNYNGIGLYTWNAATQTLTLVASTPNAADFWSTLSIQTWNQKAFSVPYAATSGLYFIGLLYNQSAQVTAPALPTFTWGTGSASILSAGIALVNTFRAGLNMSVTGQTSLPASTDTNTVFNSANPFIVALY